MGGTVKRSLLKNIVGWRMEPIYAGLLMALLAVLAGQFSGLSALDHYGFCTTCHGHDLIVGLGEQLSFLNLSNLGTPIVWPIFTTVGVVLGAWLSARFNGEMPRIRRRIEWPAMGRRFSQGLLAMSFALLAMGCPIRMTIRAADLNLQGAVGLAGVAIGVTLASLWLKFRAGW